MSLIQVASDVWLPDRALKFGAAITDLVDVGSGNVIGAQCTVLAWIKPSSFINNRMIFASRYSASGVSAGQLRLSGNVGRFQFIAQQTTANANWISVSNMLAVEEWAFVAATYDEAATPRIHLYRGSLTQPLAEVTYFSTSDGSGTFAGFAGGNNYWSAFNTSSALSATLAFPGLISFGQTFTRVLTVNEMGAVQKSTLALRAGSSSTYLLGDNGVPAGATQWDLSGNGNNGTVTGATEADGPLKDWYLYNRGNRNAIIGA